ncbi:MAG: 1,2-phenylacetyl-CoA epoxidase subunit A [Actinobacteria bacterium]|nr:1,2-phenylacetyl-CoA epoxidase subunit A [Actinomycetota bacterium]
MSDTATPSARPLLLSVLGDVVLPSGGRAWLGALTEAMGTLDVSPQAVRQALRRLVGQHIVEPERHGRLAAYQLTAPGRRRLEEAADRIYLRRSLVWDGRWRILTYSFAEENRSARDALRRELEWLGYGALGSGMWICPWDLGTRLDTALAKHGITGQVESFVSELEGDDRGVAARAYDLSELRAAHQAFLERFSPELEDAPEGLDDAEAFARRILLLHEWRKFLFLDPGLPQALLPTDWLGDQAAELFVELYRRYDQPAWAFWDRVSAEADPDGVAPSHPRSNLDPTSPSHRHDGPRASVGDGPRATAGDGRTTAAQAEERRTEEFLERIHGGGKVEATDWMPDEYRRLNLRFIEMHANSEIMGALPEREWIARAPSLKRKRSLSAKVQDEVGHAHLIYRVAETLGKPRQQMYEDLIFGRGKFHNVFHYPTHSWGDVACIGFLVDGAAIVTQRALLDTSYAPYVRVMRRVVAEESLHYRHGEDVMLALAAGTDEQFEMLQEAVTRWWTPTMHFFGTDVAAEDDPAIHWGIKTQTNEEARQEWINQYVPKLWDMGIELPDPALRYDPQDKRWHYTEPDWDELKDLLRNPTETVQRRLAWRQAIWEHHEWIHRIVTGDTVPAAA